MICKAGERQVQAFIEEIPMRGLERNLIALRNPNKPRPLKWRITSGFLTTMSADAWMVGYGGFQVYISPKLVAGIKQLATASTPDRDPIELYNEANQYILGNIAYIKRPKRLFPPEIEARGLIKSS
jgi:hypothetical protein